VILAELTDMPREMLVEKLGTNRNALYKLAHDARKRLRAGLERDGFGAEDVRKAFDG
jgi:RNA polymerase sigma-70 factor (ECF subfamily)